MSYAAPGSTATAEGAPPGEPRAAGRTPWPAGAVAAVAALRAAGGAGREQRHQRRVRYEVWATLLTESELTPDAGHAIYTRDAEPRAVGFVTSDPLILGSRATVHVTGPDGKPLALTCRVRRCREFRAGWYEGVLLLADEQPAFNGARMAEAGE